MGKGTVVFIRRLGDIRACLHGDLFDPTEDNRLMRITAGVKF